MPQPADPDPAPPAFPCPGRRPSGRINATRRGPGGAMAIEFVCPECHSGLRVGDDTAGKVVRCGSCMATVK
ncbi:MAG: hypothetical protein K2P78_07305, partial [Gemmataceae bacterium]|nr:hypothetical protein [Gemmataceae bacterium]